MLVGLVKLTHGLWWQVGADYRLGLVDAVLSDLAVQRLVEVLLGLELLDAHLKLSDLASTLLQTAIQPVKPGIGHRQELARNLVL